MAAGAPERSEPPGGGGDGGCRVCDWARGLLAAAGMAAAPAGRGDVLAATAPPVIVAAAAASGDAAAAAAAPKPGGGEAARRADCLGCRLTGLMAGLAGAGYLSSRLLEEPPPRGAHRSALLASSAALAGLGVARGLGWY